jgi:mono/diheme cytochrome c family protein
MRPNLKTIRLLLALAGPLLGFAAAQDQAQKAANLTANPTYQHNCAKCHGDNAEGRHFRGPSLISGKAASASNDDLRNIIANGKGHMPKYGGKLGSGEIEALVDQIKAAQAK